MHDVVDMCLWFCASIHLKHGGVWYIVLVLGFFFFSCLLHAFPMPDLKQKKAEKPKEREVAREAALRCVRLSFRWCGGLLVEVFFIC